MSKKSSRVLDLEKTLAAIIEMIDECLDSPKATDSLPQCIRFLADEALRGHNGIVLDARNFYNGHVLYTQGDRHYAPDSIKDRNGDIVLAMCKQCNRGEIELETPCDYDPS